MVRDNFKKLVFCSQHQQSSGSQDDRRWRDATSDTRAKLHNILTLWQYSTKQRVESLIWCNQQSLGRSMYFISM